MTGTELQTLNFHGDKITTFETFLQIVAMGVVAVKFLFSDKGPKPPGLS